MTEEIILPPNGELKSNDVTIYFDNVCDDNGVKLVKSEKRSRIRNFMNYLYENKEMNKCVLEDGRVVPIIVKRKGEGRPAFCYFNSVEAPKDEILKAFADNTGITFKKDAYPPKKEGELIVSDIKNIIDNVLVDGKKVSGIKKIKALKDFFEQLYLDEENNVCKLPTGEYVPIVVKRLSANNIVANCLNTSEHRQEILRAFAQKMGCTYQEYKENEIKPDDKREGELTTRECYHFLYLVKDLNPRSPKDDGSSRLVEWFEAINNSPSQNKVVLPNGEEHPLVVYRVSYAQRCVCLNTSDERIKPFAIKRMAELTEATINLDNIEISSKSSQELIETIKLLDIAGKRATNSSDRSFYNSYKQKVYNKLSLTDKEISVNEWLKNKFTKDK